MTQNQKVFLPVDIRLARANGGHVPKATQRSPRDLDTQTFDFIREGDTPKVRDKVSVPYLREIHKDRKERGMAIPNNHFAGKRVPLPHEITITQRMGKESHPFYSFIAKKTPLDQDDFASIIISDDINMRIPIHSTGAIPASEGSTHQSVWTRDAAAIGLAWEAIGDDANAALVTECLYKAASSQSQRQKINEYLAPADLAHRRGIWLPDDEDANKTVPHVKFTLDDVSKELLDCDHPWGMQQLDAYGYKLLLIGKLLEKNKIDIKAIDDINDPNSETVLVALTRMLKNLEFWDKLGDSGAWEKDIHEGRLSSLAAALSGLVAIRDYFNKFQGREQDLALRVSNADNGYSLEQYVKDMDYAIEKAKKVLSERVQFEKPVFEVEADGHPHNRDAALSFMLVLSDADKIGLDTSQKFAILRTVYSLMGEAGFRRFPNDSYMGMNWTDNPLSGYNPKGEVADLSPANYRSAEWSMFDPYLATINYKLFEESLETNASKMTAIDYDSYHRADMHIRRMLSQVVPRTLKYKRKTDKGDLEVVVPKGELTEAWFLQRYKSGNRNMSTWWPGENYGLNWTKAAVQQALSVGHIVSGKYAELDKKGIIFTPNVAEGYYRIPQTFRGPAKAA